MSDSDTTGLTTTIRRIPEGIPARARWRPRTMSNNYGARQCDWKLVHSTEGEASPGPKQTPARNMLFNLAKQHQEVVEKLTALLQKMIDEGRSTPGAPQPNTWKVTTTDPGRSPSPKN